MPPSQAAGNMIDQAAKDTEHLRLLTIFHYVLAGIVALFASFPIIHFFAGLGLVLFGDHLGPPDMKDGPPMKLMGGFFMAFAAVWILVGWSVALCLVFAGRSLRQRRRYVFCFVVAAVSCVTCMPFGTALGIFTILVLQRPTVKAAFGTTVNFVGD